MKKPPYATPFILLAILFLSCKSFHKGNQMYDSSQKYLDSATFLLHTAIKIYPKDSAKANRLGEQAGILQKRGSMYQDSMTYYFNK